MREDPGDHIEFFDGGDDLHRPAAVRAVLDVDVEGPLMAGRRPY